MPTAKVLRTTESNMKTINYFLLAAILISSVACSSAANQTVAVNVNAAQTNVANTETNAAPVIIENEAKKTAPEAVVKDLYKTHDNGNGKILDGKNRALLDKYFDKNLAGLMWKDLTTHQEEVGVLDFDPFFNAQEIEIKNFAVGAAKIENGAASVPVTFNNYDRKEKLVYSLVEQGAAWKISDIKYTDGSTLLGYFKEDAQNNAASGDGEFEGTYQVGETTCTVKPIKMAFEVKWARGTGTEIFFYQDRANDKYIFASEPKTGKANVFSFDDENYNTGIFYRADGKEFPIKRVK